MSPDKDTLKAYFDDLIQATKSGSMDWVAINPTTFAWDTSTPVPARLILQAVERQTLVTQPRPEIRQTKGYVFQAFDLRGTVQKLKLSVDGFENEELNRQLAALYQAIAASVSQESLNFLKSILPPKSTA